MNWAFEKCAQTGLIDPREVKDGTMVRVEKAYPVYDQTYQESVATIRQYLETLSNLQTIGRNGLHRYNNQDHSMLPGVYAVGNTLGEDNTMSGRSTLRRKITAMEEFEDEVIEVAFGGNRSTCLRSGAFLASAILLLRSDSSGRRPNVIVAWESPLRM